MIKYGARDQSGKKKKLIKGKRTPIRSVNGLSNADIVNKSKFRPREYHKVEGVLRHRGLTWATEV